MVGGDYGPAAVNVAAQQRDPGSLLSWVSLLIRRYRQCPELGWGGFTVLDHEVPAVLAHRADHDGGTIVAVHNLDQDPVEVILTLGGLGPDHRLVDLLGTGITTVDRNGTVRLSLDGYGCRWLRAARPGATLVL